MTDVTNAGGGETRIFPPYDCHFIGRNRDDIHREVKELIYDILKNRELSRSEEKVFREVANETVDIMISAHCHECKEKRIDEEKAVEERRKKDDLENQKKGRDWLGLMINLLSMLIALAAVIYAVHSKTGGGTP